MENISLIISNMGSQRVEDAWKMYAFTHHQRLYYIKGGEGWYYDERGRKIAFEAGAVYLFPYNFPVAFDTNEADSMDHIFVDFLSTPPIIASEPIIWHPHADAPVVKLMLALEQIHFMGEEFTYRGRRKIGYIAAAEHGSETEKEQLLYNLMMTILNLLSYEQHIPFSGDKVVSDALEYIHNHYSEPLKVSELASRAGFETNHFIRRFKAVMRQTPYAYLRAYRLMRAREMMDAGYSVANAAELVGYEHSCSLSHAMKDSRRSAKGW